MNKWQERNEKVIKEFRTNGGKVKGWAPLILLTTRGAKTGQPRTIPLMYVPYGKTVLAVASKGGATRDPDWYYNVLAHPDVTVEVGNEQFEATARILLGAKYTVPISMMLSYSMEFGPSRNSMRICECEESRHVRTIFLSF